MAFFTDETIERVREAADIVEIVSAYTDLRRQGQQYTGLCPFHDERTPSFSIDPLKKVYYCFGCEAGGDVIRFIREKESIDFPAAVEQLADRFGVPVEYEESDPDVERKRRERARLYELLEQAADYYERYLWESEEAKQARDYLASRGLEDEVLRKFRVGYAPSAWDKIKAGALKRGYSEAELRAAGLVASGRSGGVYDRFRGRITFPLSDTRGRVVGFGARASVEGQQPKYLNSPDGPIYRKGHYLFGLDIAKGPMAKASEGIVVEGYTDVLAMHQAGFDNAVAIMGTAFTREQIGELARLASTVILALDADRSGQEAMLRVLEMARDRRLELKVVRLPDDKDPCELLHENGRDGFANRIEGAVPLLQFQVDTVLDRAKLGSASGKDSALAELVPVFSRANSSVEKEEQIRRVASKLDIPDHLLTRLRSTSGSSSTRQPTATPASGSRAEEAERTFLAMCVAAAGDGAPYLARVGETHFSSALLWRAVERLREGGEDPLAGVDQSDAELVGLISELTLRSREMPASERALEVEYLRLEQGRLERQLAEANARAEDTRALQRERDETVQAIRDAMARSM